MKGIDPSKDQSYFLYTLKQKQLARILFPIGEYEKSKVRELAKKFNLPTFAKKDSQGICFIGKINVTEFLREHVKATAGEIVSSSGERLGKHSGLPFYTIGQREGIGLGGDGPYYVVAKDFEANKLIVSNDASDPMLWKTDFTIGELSWVGEKPKFPLNIGVSIRYHHPEYEAFVYQLPNNTLHISFDKPQRAITPGQSAVLYQGDEMIGGGIIENVL
jgi:tRNA-specific 2-thiouridylase